MFIAIKRQWKVSYRDWPICYVVMLGSAVFGMILLTILMRTDPTVEAWFPMGTVMAGLIACFYLFMIGAAGDSSAFNIEVGMGSTRKHFFVSYYVITLLQSLSCAVVVWAVYLAETLLWNRVYAPLRCEVEMFPMLFGLGLLLSFILPMLGMFVAELVGRFGKRAGWALWMLWMASFIFVPRFMDAAEETPESIFGRVGSVFLGILHAFTPKQWAGIVLAVSLACFGIAWVMAKKRQVAG